MSLPSELHMRHTAHILLAACALIGLFTQFARAGQEKTINVGQSIADEIGVTVRDENKADGGSCWRVGTDFQIFLAPDLPRGQTQTQVMTEPEETKAKKPGRPTVIVGLGMPYLVKVGQIKSIQYTIRVPKATPSNVHLSLRLYTAPDSDARLKNDGEFFQRRLIAEPLYVKDYATYFQENRWGTARTDHPVAPMIWYDYPRTPAGFVTAPTLAQLQNADDSMTWRDFSPQAKGSLPEDSCAMGESIVKYISVMTYHNEGSWKDFKGDLDSMRVELVTGEVVVVDFGKTDGTTLPAGNALELSLAGAGFLVFLIVVIVAEKKRRASDAARIAS